MKLNQITFRVTLLITSTLLISCGAPQERSKIKNEALVLMDQLTYSYDIDVASVSEQLEHENHKYAELKKKARHGRLTVSEEKEVQEILHEKISAYRAENSVRNQSKKNHYQVIVFKDNKCRKCAQVLHMVNEVAPELGVSVAVLKPEDFYTYAKINKIEYEPVSKIWINLYSNPASLNRVISNLPIMLYSGKKSGILTVARVDSIKSKHQLRDEIVVTMDTWDSILPPMKLEKKS